MLASGHWTDIRAFHLYTPDAYWASRLYTLDTVPSVSSLHTRYSTECPVSTHLMQYRAFHLQTFNRSLTNQIIPQQAYWTNCTLGIDDHTINPDTSTVPLNPSQPQKRIAGQLHDKEPPTNRLWKITESSGDSLQSCLDNISLTIGEITLNILQSWIPDLRTTQIASSGDGTVQSVDE